MLVEFVFNFHISTYFHISMHAGSAFPCSTEKIPTALNHKMRIECSNLGYCLPSQSLLLGSGTHNSSIKMRKHYRSTKKVRQNAMWGARKNKRTNLENRVKERNKKKRLYLYIVFFSANGGCHPLSVCIKYISLAGIEERKTLAQRYAFPLFEWWCHHPLASRCDHPFPPKEHTHTMQMDIMKSTKFNHHHHRHSVRKNNKNENYAMRVQCTVNSQVYLH